MTTIPQPNAEIVEEHLDAARRWAKQLNGDIVLVPFKDGAPDWSMTRRDLDWPDIDTDPADLPRLGIITDSFHSVANSNVPFGSGVTVLAWWDNHGAEHVRAIEGDPEYREQCEGIIKRSIEGRWPVLRRAPKRDFGVPVVDLAAWEGKTVEPRLWFISDLIPGRNVTLLYGDGGLGKSLLALQIGLASTLGTSTLGLTPLEYGRVLYLAAEDEADEFHRRSADILRGFDASFADTGGRFHLVPLADRDALLATPDRFGVMQPTPLFGKMADMTKELGPDLIVIDTAADVFGGKEIDRSQARQFISMLRRVCLERNCTIMLLAHPSVQGMQTGTGTSGSTGWSNSARARLYVDRPSGDGTDPDMRRLSVKKQNYGAAEGEIFFRWENGMFVEADSTKPSPTVSLMNKKADEVFLRLLSTFNRIGQPCSPSPSVTYGPKRMESHPDAEGIKKKVFEQAMHRLLKSGEIKIVEDGPPSKRRSRLWVTAENFGADAVSG